MARSMARVVATPVASGAVRRKDGLKETDPATIVGRPRLLPNGLVRVARERGVEPGALLREVVGQYPTFAEAAADLGITRMTLRSWLKRFNSVVSDGAGS